MAWGLDDPSSLNDHFLRLLRSVAGRGAGNGAFGVCDAFGFVLASDGETLTWDPAGNGSLSGARARGTPATPTGGMAADSTWADGNDARFQGTGGTVTISGPFAPHSLFFNSTGYTLTGSQLTLGGGTVSVAAGAATVINSVLGGLQLGRDWRRPPAIGCRRNVHRFDHDQQRHAAAWLEPHGGLPSGDKYCDRRGLHGCGRRFRRYRHQLEQRHQQRDQSLSGELSQCGYHGNLE